MIAARFLFRCRICEVKCVVRFASALPKALPTASELTTLSDGPKKSAFAPPSSSVDKNKPLRLPQIINLSENAAKEAKRTKEWRRMEPNGLIKAYLQLSKHRLTALITTTAAAGYLISPLPIDYPTFVYCLLGTALLSSSANACNHILEAPYDAQMRRTQSRVLVIHRITPLHAIGFAVFSAAVGLGFLCVGCNSLAATLGLLNLVLYACVYTPMKRYHIGCTWIGAVVGAIPPLMGYTAYTGQLDLAALTLAGILYSWQFPHFNALSWNLRGDYSRAGYRVMCVTNEELCRKTSIRHAVALLGFCSIAAPLTHLTTIVFALDSIPLNVAMIYFGYRFYRNPNEKTAKALFRYSLIYLPIIMALMVISNAGHHNLKDSSSKKGGLGGEEGDHFATEQQLGNIFLQN